MVYYIDFEYVNAEGTHVHSDFKFSRLVDALLFATVTLLKELETQNATEIKIEITSHQP